MPRARESADTAALADERQPSAIRELWVPTKFPSRSKEPVPPAPSVGILCLRERANTADYLRDSLLIRSAMQLPFDSF